MKQRNQTMELCRLIAAFFVVFIHIVPRGGTGIFLKCLARFAVPFFFMASGYFSFQVDCDRLKRRIVHFLPILLLANLAGFVSDLLQVYLSNELTLDSYLKNLFTFSRIYNLLFQSLSPFLDILWFLNALLYCYLLFWLYTRFQGQKEKDYRPLYLLAVVLLLFFYGFLLLASLFSSNSDLNLSISLKYYRNFAFFGWPCFSIGLFLREYQDQIFVRFGLTCKRLIFLWVAGALLAVVECYGNGQKECYLGSFVMAVSFVLLAARRPILTTSPHMQSFFSWCGRISLMLYFWHGFLWYEVISGYNEYLPLLNSIKESSWRIPIIIAVSLLLGTLCLLVSDFFRVLCTRWRKARTMQR